MSKDNALQGDIKCHIPVHHANKSLLIMRIIPIPLSCTVDHGSPATIYGES
ncbi:unnamed protein product [Prunus brigantina]